MLKVRLNNKFYDAEVVEEAIRDFRGVCRGRIVNDKIEVELEQEEEISTLADEFCNYVLGLMKNKTIV
jgi:hypothetical protein